MGTQILRPQDILTGRIRVSPAAFHRRKSCNYGNSFSNTTKSNRKTQSPQPPVRVEKTDRRRRASSEPAISKRSTSDDLKRSSSDDLKRSSSEDQKRSSSDVLKKSSSDDLKKSSSEDLKRSSSEDLSKSGLAMEKVTILRRGESLDSQLRSRDPSRKEVTARQGLDDEVRSTVSANMYAGSTFVVSPEPSSLPLPSFSRKKHVSIDDSATRDLRRLLRLD